MWFGNAFWPLGVISARKLCISDQVRDGTYLFFCQSKMAGQSNQGGSGQAGQTTEGGWGDGYSGLNSSRGVGKGRAEWAGRDHSESATMAASVVVGERVQCGRTKYL